MTICKMAEGKTLMERLFTVIFVLFLFTVQGYASGESKIIVKSFYTEKNADNGLNNLVKTMQSNPKMIQYQDEHDFYFATRKSGSYTILILEPFKDSSEYKKVLKEIKKHYKGAFVNKIKDGSTSIKTLKLKSTLKPKQKPVSKPTPKPKENVVAYEEIEVIEADEKIENKPSMYKQLDVQDTELPNEKVEKKIDTKPQVVVALEEKIIPVEDANIEENSSWSISTYLLIILIIVVAILIWVILILRRKNIELEHMVQYMHSAEVKSEYALAEEKEMFLAKVSHELRTPMSAIIGLSHLLLQGKLNDVQHNNIKKIKESGEVILEIVNDILDISKIDAGALKIENIDFDINEVLEHLSNMTSLKAEDKGLNLVYDIDQSVPSRLVGDPLRLGQILINLIDNAIKFTKKGSIELKINTLDDDFESRVGLEFRVIDHGMGMDESQLKNLFKDFTQADETISRKYGGTGLGLSIVKQLVDMMSGTIDVNSEYGDGTEFIVRIYFTKFEVNNKRHYRLPSKSLMGKNAIIVDSNARSVESLTNMLKYFHYKVEVVSNIKWAEELLSQVAYDVIFIDENILLSTSIDLIKDIKTKYKLKVVLIESLYYQHNNEIREIEEIDAYLLKPFNQNVIFNLILEIYGKLNKAEAKPNIKKDDLLEFKNINIFVVDDNALNLKIIKGLLDGTGFNLTMLNNGVELLNKLEEDSNVDLILLDINMDIMDGYETTKEIRKESKYDEIPIFALTAYTDQKNMDKAIEAGMQGYLTKPLNVTTMYEKLYSLFNMSDKITKQEEKIKVKDPNSHLYKELDIDSGLENSNSNAKLYHALLNDFVNMYSDANSVIDSSVEEERYSDTKNFVHDVKNLSEHLGGHIVSQSAAKIEDAFVHDKFNKNSILIDRLKRDLEAFILDINKYLKDVK